MQNLSSDRSRDSVSIAHIEWGQAQRRKLGPVEMPVAQDRDPSRVLKIGYLSADLFEHVVGEILVTTLKGHRHVRQSKFMHSSGHLVLSGLWSLQGM